MQVSILALYLGRRRSRISLCKQDGDNKNDDINPINLGHFAKSRWQLNSQTYVEIVGGNADVRPASTYNSMTC
jgi:hypothetical protein